MTYAALRTECLARYAADCSTDAQNVVALFAAIDRLTPAAQSQYRFDASFAMTGQVFLSTRTVAPALLAEATAAGWLVEVSARKNVTLTIPR